MVGVTDTVFRRMIRSQGGCGLIMTEFTSADGVLRAKDKKAKRYLHFYEDEHPISAQLFGSDPQVIADAARIVEDLGFDLVEVSWSETGWDANVGARILFKLCNLLIANHPVHA